MKIKTAIVALLLASTANAVAADWKKWNTPIGTVELDVESIALLDGGIRAGRYRIHWNKAMHDAKRGQDFDYVTGVAEVDCNRVLLRQRDLVYYLRVSRVLRELDAGSWQPAGATNNLYKTICEASNVFPDTPPAIGSPAP